MRNLITKGMVWEKIIFFGGGGPIDRFRGFSVASLLVCNFAMRSIGLSASFVNFF